MVTGPEASDSDGGQPPAGSYARDSRGEGVAVGIMGSTPAPMAVVVGQPVRVVVGVLQHQAAGHSGTATSSPAEFQSWAVTGCRVAVVDQSAGQIVERGHAGGSPPVRSDRSGSVSRPALS